MPGPCKTRKSQLSFADLAQTGELTRAKAETFTLRAQHGGNLNQGRRKTARPLDTRKPLHLVFRSARARGKWSLKQFKHSTQIEKLARSLAKKHQIRLYQYANAGNHLHLFVRAKDRTEFKKFTRTLAGLVARMVTGAKKGSPKGRFWDSLFFSRVVEWGRSFVNAKDYVLQNELEADGWMDYRPRKAGPIKPNLRP
jgi:REP element-mobilizing transposase RayT